MGDFLVPDWAEKFGTYITDRGTLIRAATFSGGAALVLIGLVVLLRKQASGVAAQVAKVVV